LRDLQNEQQKLLQLFYRDGVDEEVLQAEQERIEAERTQARRWLASASQETDEAETALDETLAIMQGCHAIYLAADPELRRLMNQAIFTRLLIGISAIEGEEQPVAEHIHALRGSKTVARARRPRNGQDPRLLGGLGSNVGQLVPPSDPTPQPPRHADRVSPCPPRAPAAADAQPPAMLWSSQPERAHATPWHRRGRRPARGTPTGALPLCFVCGTERSACRAEHARSTT
jgi:hypothetical protein